MAEKIIKLRPHHIDRFADYYYNRELFDKPNSISSRSILENYKEVFVKNYKEVFDSLILGGSDKDFILVKNGLDDICYMCPRKKESCSKSDSLSLWNGSGYVMQEMNLREGFLYTIKEFLGKINQIHPDRNSVER